MGSYSRPHDIGVYNQGDVPVPLSHSFYQSDGSPYDITDWNADAVVSSPYALTGLVTISDPKAGTLTLTWAPGDMDLPGSYSAVLIVENEDGSIKLSSDPIIWRVAPLPSFDESS